MAATPEELRKAMETMASHLANESAKASKSWEDIAGHVQKSTGHLTSGWGGVLTQLLGNKSTISLLSTAFVDGLTGSTTAMDKLNARFSDLLKQVTALHDLTIPDDADQSAEWQAAKAELLKVTNQLNSVEDLTKTISKTVSGKMGAAFLAIAGSLKVSLAYSHAINDALKQGNASLETRSRLTQEISAVQGATGNSVDDMAKAAAALTSYGFDLRNNFKETLVTVVKMEEGLGVSYETSAKLASVTGSIGANFNNVADTVARIKSDTALAAEEAVKYATEIGKALSMLKPGSGSQLAQTSEYLSGMAGSLKELGANGDDFVNMMVGFTKASGMSAGMQLGAAPDFIASTEKTKRVTENFVKFIGTQLAGLDAQTRAGTIASLAKQFNTTEELIGNAERMLQKYNTTQKSTTTLQDQWRLQTSEIGDVFKKVYESMKSTIQQTLLPALQKLRPILADIADVASYLATQSWAVYTVGTTLIVSALAATVAMTKLAYSITKAAIAASGYTAATSASGIFSAGGAEGLAKLLGANIGRGGVVPGYARDGTWVRSLQTQVMLWLPRIGGWLSTAASVLSKLAGPLTIAAAAGVVAGLAIDKGLKAMGVDLSKILVTTQKSTFRTAADAAGYITRNELLRGVSTMVQEGKSASNIKDYLLKNADRIKGIHGESITTAKRMEILDKIIADTRGIASRQKNSITQNAMGVTYPGDTKKLDELSVILKEIAGNTSFANEIRQRVEQKNAEIEADRKAMYKKEAEAKRIRNQQYPSLAPYNSFNLLQPGATH